HRRLHVSSIVPVAQRLGRAQTDGVGRYEVFAEENGQTDSRTREKVAACGFARIAVSGYSFGGNSLAIVSSTIPFFNGNVRTATWSPVGTCSRNFSCSADRSTIPAHDIRCFAASAWTLLNTSSASSPAVPRLNTIA